MNAFERDKKFNKKKSNTLKRLEANAKKWQKEVDECRQEGRDITKVKKQRDALQQDLDEVCEYTS